MAPRKRSRGAGRVAPPPKRAQREELSTSSEGGAAPRSPSPAAADDGSEPGDDAVLLPLIIEDDGDGVGAPPPTPSPSSVEPGSPAAGAAVLARWLHPLPLAAFFGDVFEKRALLVRRGEGGRGLFDGLLTPDGVWAAAAAGALSYGTGVDVVAFDGKKRVTLNKKEGTVASEADLKASFARGDSLRALHPQRWPHAPALASALADLEGYWRCVVGANAYMTPAGGRQGFAPHADDVDVFILQLAGAKAWTVRAPRSPDDVLPLVSSPDFGPGEAGEVALEATLRPGDCLYLPRGAVHSARTPSDEGGGASSSPSLHVTVSVCQGVSWAALLRAALPRALDLAAETTLALRRSVPRPAYDYMGVVHADAGERAASGEGGEAGAPPALYSARAAARAAFEAAAVAAALAVVDALPLDAAMDAMAAEWLAARMPLGGGGARAAPAACLPPRVRPVAGGSAARLAVEDDVAVVHHCLANEARAHAAAEGGGGARLEFPLDAAPALEILLGSHSPHAGAPIEVAGLPGGRHAEAAARALLAAGVVVPA